MKITFYQWLNAYEFMTKREFKELPKYKQENYRTQYKLFLMTEKGGKGKRNIYRIGKTKI